MHPVVTFAGIGAQKCGSGWLFRMLQQHPEVTTPIDPAHKELDFFNNRWHLGTGWYESLFPRECGSAGEFSVLYASSADAPVRMHRYNPEIRLILCVRHPVDRAYSQHRYLVGRGLVPATLRHFSDAWDRNPSYEEQGRYGAAAERFLELFDREQLLIINYDDLKENSAAVMFRVFQHLGVDPTFIPTGMARRYNDARQFRGIAAERAQRLMFAAAKSALPRNQFIRLRGSAVAVRARSVTTRPVSAVAVPPLTDSERQRFGGCFLEDLRRLSEISGIDYACWLDGVGHAL